MAHSPTATGLADTEGPPLAEAPGLGEAGRTRPRGPVGADPDKRRRLLAAAVRTFGRRGFHEARISEIAAAAKVAEGTVYLYFRNKEDLLSSVFDETMDGVLAEAQAIRRSDAPAPERLKRLVGLHVAFLSEDRDLASVFQIELRRSARLVERFSRSKLVEYLRMLEAVMREGIASGELRAEVDPRLAVRILFGAADEMLSDWLLSGEPRPYAGGQDVVEALLMGFAAPSATARRRSPPKKAKNAKSTKNAKGASKRSPR